MSAVRQQRDGGLVFNGNGDASGGALQLVSGSYVVGNWVSIGTESKGSKLFVSSSASGGMTGSTIKVEARYNGPDGHTVDTDFGAVGMPTKSWNENAAALAPEIVEHVYSGAKSDVIVLDPEFTGQVRVSVKAAGTIGAAAFAKVAMRSGSGA